jgi:hypothetical protein
VLAALPYLVLKALRTTVKMVRTIVYRKGVFYTIKSELAKGNAVGITSRNLSGAWTVAKITCGICISEYNVCKIAILVRNDYRHYSCTDI